MIPLAAALACFATLALAGAFHLLNRESLEAQIAAQHLWPPNWVPAVAMLLPGTEALVGLLGLAAILVGSGVAAAALASAALFSSFALFSAFLMLRRPGAPCACSSNARRIDWMIVGRAAMLGCLAVVTFAAVPALDELEAVEAMFSLLIGAAGGLIVWLLPEALTDPLSSFAVVPAAESA